AEVVREIVPGRLRVRHDEVRVSGAPADVRGTGTGSNARGLGVGTDEDALVDKDGRRPSARGQRIEGEEDALPARRGSEPGELPAYSAPAARQHPRDEALVLRKVRNRLAAEKSQTLEGQRLVGPRLEEVLHVPPDTGALPLKATHVDAE